MDKVYRNLAIVIAVVAILVVVGVMLLVGGSSSSPVSVLVPAVVTTPSIATPTILDADLSVDAVDTLDNTTLPGHTMDSMLRSPNSHRVKLPPMTLKFIAAHINQSVVPFSQIAGMPYFHDVPITNTTETALGMVREYPTISSFPEYALVTVDIESLYQAVSTTGLVPFRVKGEDYTAHMTMILDAADDDGSWFKSYDGIVYDANNTPVNGIAHIQIFGRSDSLDSHMHLGGCDIELWRNSPYEERYEMGYSWIRSDGQYVYVIHNLDKSYESEGRGELALWELSRSIPNNTEPAVTIVPSTDVPPVKGVRSIKSVHYPRPTVPANAVTRGNASWVVPVYGEALGVTGTASDTPATIDVLVVYDTEFKNKYPNNHDEKIGAVLTRVNTAFAAAGVTFNQKETVYDSTLTSTSSDRLICKLVDGYLASERSSHGYDVVFLFTGKVLMGGTLGVGSVYSGGSVDAYGVAQMETDGYGTVDSYRASEVQQAILTAHELGHILNANHDNAYSWRECPSCSYRYTIMSAIWRGDAMRLEFSDKYGLHGDTTHRNVQRIQNAKATVAAFY